MPRLDAALLVSLVVRAKTFSSLPHSLALAEGGGTKVKSIRGVPIGWRMWPYDPTTSPATNITQQCNCTSGKLMHGAASGQDCKCYKCGAGTNATNAELQTYVKNGGNQVFPCPEGKCSPTKPQEFSVCGPPKETCSLFAAGPWPFEGCLYIELEGAGRLACDSDSYGGRQRCYIGGAGDPSEAPDGSTLIGNGPPFDDFMDAKAYGPQTLGVRYGNVIDQVEFKYANIAEGQPNPVTHGDTGGQDRSDFVIDDDEHIIRATVCSSFEKAQFVVSDLQVKTDNGRTSQMYGGTPGWRHNNLRMCTSVALPEGYEVKSWFGRDGKYLDALGFYYGPIADCTENVQTPKAYWKPLQYFGSYQTGQTCDEQASGKQTFHYSVGNTKALTVGSKTGWAKKIAGKVTGGYKFGTTAGLGGSVEIEVSGENAWSGETSVEEAASLTKTIETSIETGAGQMWQWAVSITDECSTSEVRTRIVAVTPNLGKPPCCPPGWAMDPRNMLGECVNASLNLCKASA